MLLIVTDLVFCIISDLWWTIFGPVFAVDGDTSLFSHSLAVNPYIWGENNWTQETRNIRLSYNTKFISI